MTTEYKCFDFLISDHPDFYSEIILMPIAEQSKFELELWDSHGNSINQLSVEATSAPVILKASTLLSSCIMESGMRHAYLRVKGLEGAVYCRMRGQQISSLLSPFEYIQAGGYSSLPLLISGERPGYLLLINTSDQEIAFRCRLITASRTPEREYVITAYSSKVISILEDYREVIPKQGAMYCYVRIATSSSGLAYKLLESSAPEYLSFLSAVC